MTYVLMTVKDADGKTRRVDTISSNLDHVGNRIAEGDLDEAQRLPEVVRLYESQMSSLQGDLVMWRNRAVLAEAKLRELGA